MPGHEPLQQPPGEYRHVDVGRLRPTVRSRDRPRFEGDEPVPASLVGEGASEAGPPGGAWPGWEVALWVGLPELEHGVGDGRAGPVDYAALDADRARALSGTTSPPAAQPVPMLTNGPAVCEGVGT